MFDPNLARVLNPYLFFAATIGILLAVVGVYIGALNVTLGLLYACIFIFIMVVAALMEQQD
jgi:hypothetical protein